jgi:hypothetical protein
MGRPARKAKSSSIEELAFAHYNQHLNDRRGGVKAKMLRQFGREPTMEALKAAREIIRIVDPEHPIIKEPWKAFR